MSVGTTHRNNSQHNTNRSAKASAISSKSNGRHISAYQNSSEFTTKNLSVISNKICKKSDLDATMRDSNSKEDDIQQPAILKSSCNSKQQVSEATTEVSRVRPFTIERGSDMDSALTQVQNEMEVRRKNYLKNYKTKLDLNDILELRNPQSVVEFIPEIIENMRNDELNHMYPHNFLDRSFQDQISEKYRQYLVDWLAELHYKFKMWPETLYVTVGIIDKTLMNWRNFKKQDLQCLGITALHIAGKYEEIYPPELKTILGVIDNAVTRDQVCKLEYDILQLLNFDMVWPSILRFMERYSMIANFNKEQQMIAQMLCDFILLDMSLLQKKPSLLGAVAVYATNMITNKNNSKCWNQGLQKCTGGLKEEEVKPLAKHLFYFIKKLEQSSLKTMFRKYELPTYQGVVKVISKI